MKVKLRFLPLNIRSKDIVVSKGIKHVLDLTLNTSKLWKSVVDHIHGKWAEIEELHDRLELFLAAPSSTKINCSQADGGTSLTVQAIIGNLANPQNVTATNSATGKDDGVCPIVPIHYNITEKKITANVLMSPTKQKDTPKGYSLADESWLQAFDMFSDSKACRPSSPLRLPDVTKSNNSTSSGISDHENDLVPQLIGDSMFGHFASDGPSLLGHSLMGGGLPAHKATTATTSSTSSDKRGNQHDSSQSSSSRIFDAVEQVLSQPNAKTPAIIGGDILPEKEIEQKEISLLDVGSEQPSSSDGKSVADIDRKRPAATDTDNIIDGCEKSKQTKKVRFSAEVASPKKQQKHCAELVRNVSKGHTSSVASSSLTSTQIKPEAFKALFSRVGRTNPKWKRIRPTYIGPISR